MRDPLRIFVGWDSKEPVAYHVLCHSIISRATVPVTIAPLTQHVLRSAGLYTRERGTTESTEFSLTRFLVPALSEYKGWSLFMDCDMLVKADITELWLYGIVNPTSPVSCCQHDYTPSDTTKFLGQPQTAYPRKNWSSVMLFNNELCKNLTPAYVNQASGLDLHRFNWATGPIGEIPLEWNWLVGEYPKNPQAKNLHYTLGGPWFSDYADCDHADLWRREQMDMAGIPALIEVLK